MRFVRAGKQAERGTGIFAFGKQLLDGGKIGIILPGGILERKDALRPGVDLAHHAHAVAQVAQVVTDALGALLGAGVVRNERTPRSVVERLLSSGRTKGEVPTGTAMITFDGDTMEVGIKALTNRQHKQAQNNATKKPMRDKMTGRLIEDFDNDLFMRLVCQLGITDPNLDNDDLLSAYGAPDGLALIDRMFLAGEITTISTKILELSGFSSKEVEQVRD